MSISRVRRTSSAPIVLRYECSMDEIDTMTGPCVSLQSFDPVPREISSPLVTVSPRGSPIKPYTRQSKAEWAQDFFKDSLVIIHCCDDDSVEAISNISHVPMRSDSTHYNFDMRPMLPEIPLVDGKMMRSAHHTAVTITAQKLLESRHRDTDTLSRTPTHRHAIVSVQMYREKAHDA